MKERIGVIIPTYNRCDYLREAILSVLAQTRPADEVVVVDDGSTDRTAEVCEEFPTVKYLSKANEGLPAARNYGMDHTSSELLVYLDDDDRLVPDSLEVQEKALAAHPEVALVYGRATLIDAAGQPIGQHLRNHRQPNHALAALLVENYILIQTVMARRAAVDAVGRFRKNLGEDLDLYIRLAAQGHRFLFLDRILAEYRKLPGTMSSDKLAYARAMLLTVERNVARFPRRLNKWYYTAYYEYRIGRAALERKEFGIARKAFAKAWLGRPGQGHFLAYLLVSLFPGLLGPLLSLAQRVKRSFQPLLVRLGLKEKRWGTPDLQNPAGIR